jgi:hypothetical protein
MGLKEFRFPSEQYEGADRVVVTIYDKVISHTHAMKPPEMGEYFVQHKAEIFDIFDSFPHSWRFPLLLRDLSFSTHALLFSQLHSANQTDVFNAFLYCLHFYLFLSNCRNLRKLSEKHPPNSSIISMRQLVEDEI